MELSKASPFQQHENSLKTHEKIAVLPEDVKEIHGVLSEFSIIGDFHDGTLKKKNLREKQQEDRVLFRHVPKKVLDVFVGAAVYNQPSHDWTLRVRLPSKGEDRSVLGLELGSPASQISSLSECSPLDSEIVSGDSPSLLGEAEEKEGESSPDSGCNNIIAQSSPTSTVETLTSIPEESTGKATDQHASKIPETLTSFPEESTEKETVQPESKIPETLTSFPEESTEKETIQPESKIPETLASFPEESTEKETVQPESKIPETLTSFPEESTEKETVQPVSKIPETLTSFPEESTEKETVQPESKIPETLTSFPEESTEKATVQLDSKLPETSTCFPEESTEKATDLPDSKLPETLTSFPEESTEKAPAQLDSKLPDSGEEKKEEEEEEEERTAEEKTPGPHTGSFCEEDTDFEFLESTNDVRRFSSSKASSSAGAELPCTKKEVRFADALGLDLESVKHIAPGVTAADPSAVPLQDLRNLRASEEPEDHGNVATTGPAIRLRPCFAQPGSSGSFQNRTIDQKVVLESVSLNDLELSVTGYVCVVNIGYAKRVFVRFTTNDWLNFSDLDAIYSGPSNEGRIDKFLFKINLPKSFGFGGRLEFAVCYESTSQVYWDNNFEANYLVECR